MPDVTMPCPCGCGAEFLRMVAEREGAVRAEAAAARPGRPLAAADHEGIYLITGMPGAGKSTVGRQLAERFDRGAHIDIDTVFHHFTVAGRAEPSLQTMEATAQSTLAVRNAAALARNYAEAGFVCVLEGAITRREDVLLAAEAVAPHPLLLIVLAPPLAVSDGRDAERSGKNVAEHFRHHHALIHAELPGLGAWIDSTGHSPSDTVDAILDVTELGRATVAAGRPLQAAVGSGTAAAGPPIDLPHAARRAAPLRGCEDATLGGLVVGERATRGESGGAWFGTYAGEPVVVKRAEAEARPRWEAVAALLDRLRARGVPAPAYTLLRDESDELVLVQTLLPGSVRDTVGPALVEDLLATSELLANVDGVPTIRGVDFPQLLKHSLVEGEDGWCQHEPMRTYSDRTRWLVEHAEACGAALDATSVPTSDVVHLDLHHHNLLVDEAGRLTGIIDWDGVLPGDRWFDLTYFVVAAEAWPVDPLVIAPVWAAVEGAVAPALLGAYVAHIALRLTEWQLSHHTPADVEVRLAAADRLVARYPV